MKNIQGVKIGNMVNISINGKLHKKNCGSPKEADELFRLVLKAKETPTDENVKSVLCYLNEKLRIGMMAGLETDPENGEVYLAGFNTPLPMTLVEVIKEYHENGYPLEAIINFWKLLMINPDVRVRISLFDFIKTHDFVLTDKGYMVVYKAVVFKKQSDNDLSAFVSNQYLHVKKDWKTNPGKYVVFRYLNNNTYGITKKATANTWKETEKGIEFLGNLNELYLAIFDDKDPETVYTDKYSKTMSIALGQPVYMVRRECDGDPAIECSYGLHVGATKYVEHFGSNSNAVLVCYVNPAHVVAVPVADHSKMRVSEYFPFAVATYKDGKIDIVEQAYFESDYQEYELVELEEQIAKVKTNELPIEKAKEAEDEVRPMSELMKILETRLIDLG